MIVIGGKRAILHKLIFEIRYRFGYTYLDRKGFLINRIIESYPNLLLLSNPNEATFNETTFFSQEDKSFLGVSAHHFYAFREQKIGDRGLKERDAENLARITNEVFDLISEILDLKDFSRIGFRVNYLLSDMNEQESKSWIAKTNIFNISEQFISAFKGQIESQGHTLVIIGENKKYKISLNSVKRSYSLEIGGLTIRPHFLSKKQDEILKKQLLAKRKFEDNPEYSVLIDVDTFLEEPLDINIEDFILQSFSEINESLPRAFR